MVEPWHLKGELILSCSCDVFCPCVISLGKHPPTEGTCQGWAGIRIDDGKYGETDLSGLNAGLLLDIPGLMARGNWKAAAYIDERAGDEAMAGLSKILSGSARGSTGVLSILVGEFLGVHKVPIDYEVDGEIRRFNIPKKISGTIRPIPGGSDSADVVITNSQYWIASDITIARAEVSRVRAESRLWDFAGKSAEICQLDWSGP
jgi:hypothetical protein